MVSLYWKPLFLTMRRILSLSILTSLKIAVMLANSVHSSFLCICKVIEDFFQLPETHLLYDSSTTEDCNTPSVPLNSDRGPTVSIFTQTEEEPRQYENVVETSGTDVIIVNLNSTQKLVISQGTLKTNNCKNYNSAAEMSSEKVVDVTASTVGNEGSNVSSMSIESDVLDSKIESGGCFASTSSSEKASLRTVGEGFDSLPVNTEDSHNEILSVDNDNHKSVFVDSENFDSASFNACSLPIHFDDFECLKEKVPNDTYLKCDGTALHIQKTSSPLKKHFRSPQTPCSNLSTFNDDALSQITENKDAGISVNSDCWKNDTLSANFKRRLSLPVKLNASNTSLGYFKLAQQRLIEETLKNTPRHEKSLKEIKYPFSSEISLDSKPNDGMEDKEVLSCSSYESLPVSDHLRNTLENNMLLNLYNENLPSEAKPDFSCIDNLVEAFNDVKTSLSVENIAHSKMTASAMPKTAITKQAVLKSLNVDGGQLQRSSFDLNSLGGQIINDHPKLSDNSKDTSFGTDVNKGIFSSCPSEVNPSKRFKDIYEITNRLLGWKETPAFETYSSYCSKEERRNYEEMLKSGIDNQTVMHKFWLSKWKQIFGRETDESDKNVELLPAHLRSDKMLEESAENDQKTLDQMNCFMSSVSPNNSMDSILLKYTGNLENAGLSTNHLTVRQASQQDRKAFLNRSSLHEKYPINHNISATIVPLNEDEKPKLLEDNTPSGGSMLSDLLACSGDVENAGLRSEKVKAILLAQQHAQHQYIASLNRSSLLEKYPTNQNISETIVPLNEDEKPKLLEEDTPSGISKLSDTLACFFGMENARQRSEEMKAKLLARQLAQQRYCKASLNRSSLREKYPTNQNISETIVPLNEDEKPKLLEEDTPSGGSLLSDSLACSFGGENSGLRGEKRKASILALQRDQQRYLKVSHNRSSLREKYLTNQNISETIVPLNEDEKPKLLEEAIPSGGSMLPDSLACSGNVENAGLRKKMALKILSLQLAQQQSLLASMRNAYPSYYQNSSETIVPLKEDEKPKLLEKDTSSGDSASDNSVITVKDARVADGKFKDNTTNENSD